MVERQSSRFPIQLPASFSGNREIGSGLITELSLAGCSLISDDAVQPGTTLVIHVQLPADETPLKLEGAVQWTDGAGFGLEFSRLRLEEKQRLSRFLSALERAQANRARRAS
ncbi:MAG TPA: PilZ domain-containing protein [Nitrospiraceae bacterium]|nr:PilZ domain-containing protein [Nitrospiraceae bacterium]